MRATRLLRVAADAELLRLQHMAKRHGIRAAFGLVAAIFGIGVLMLAHVVAWQLLRTYVSPIYATLILLGINFLLAAAFGLLAARSSPHQAEHDALDIRRRALEAAKGSVALGALVPIASTLLRSRQKPQRKWPFSQRRIG